jgi:hypothetical protein
VLAAVEIFFILIHIHVGFISMMAALSYGKYRTMRGNQLVNKIRTLTELLASLSPVLRTVTFWYGSGSADPPLCPIDPEAPNPANLSLTNKNQFF